MWSPLCHTPASAAPDCPVPPEHCPQDNLRDLVKFAHNEKVVLMADEVYQPNV